ncbi:MAG: hypothetical protein Q9M92_17730 [Enterobacterales bacterium]|nr:hypothetical protein [Enterobacterales bacterium]
METSQHEIRIADGNLYIDKNVYDIYFKNIESIALLYTPPLVLIMPVQQAGNGGLLLKIRTARGDRVLNIFEFLESNDLGNLEGTLPVVWCTEQAALTFNIIS